MSKKKLEIRHNDEWLEGVVSRLKKAQNRQAAQGREPIYSSLPDGDPAKQEKEEDYCYE